jgi:hypothetical protein
MRRCHASTKNSLKKNKSRKMIGGGDDGMQIELPPHDVVAYRCISNKELHAAESQYSMCSKYPPDYISHDDTSYDATWVGLNPERDNNENGYPNHVYHGSGGTYDDVRSPYLSFAIDPSQLLGGAGSENNPPKSHCHPVGGDNGRNLMRLVLTNYDVANEGEWIEFDDGNRVMYLCSTVERRLCDKPVIFYAHGGIGHGQTIEGAARGGDHPAQAALNLQEIGVAAAVGMITLNTTIPRLSPESRVQLALTGNHNPQPDEYTRNLDSQMGTGDNTSALLSWSGETNQVGISHGQLGESGTISQGFDVETRNHERPQPEGPLVEQFSCGTGGSPVFLAKRTYSSPKTFAPAEAIDGKPGHLKSRYPHGIAGQAYGILFIETRTPFGLYADNGNTFSPGEGIVIDSLDKLEIGGPGFVAYMLGKLIKTSMGEMTYQFRLNTRSWRGFFRDGVIGTATDISVAQTYIEALNLIALQGVSIEQLPDIHSDMFQAA